MNAQNATTDDAEIRSVVEQGSIELPDADTCEEELGTDPDPYAKFLCMVSQEIAHIPDGFWAKKLDEANADISGGDFHTESIHWWVPTRQIKTFHPRTRGMHAYRDSIIKAIEEVGANVKEASSQSSSSNSTADHAPVLGSDPVCHSEEDVPDNGVVDPGTVRDLSEEVCGNLGGRFIDAHSDPATFYEEREVNGILYQYSVSWVEDCGATRNKVPETQSSDPEWPTCQELFNKAFDDCSNGGIGGYVDSSCMRFTLTSGERVDDSE